MSLATGHRLGPYEIISLLGTGGMGEVYRARDTRLDRAVAIKVLPPRLANDPRLRERFDREAHAIAALNHPHICTLHDVGTQDGRAFLVMEYVDGETVASRLAKGPLPLPLALRTSMEIASALDAAHRVGIVHRDLKPANVMLTRAGAKVLDFGLARLDAALLSAGDHGDPSTATTQITAPGVVLGTFAYMSPEQLRGRQADARSDIFALGAVIYELLTGVRAFAGDDPGTTIAAILDHETPSLRTVQRQVPPSLDHVVRRCLEKDPDDRWQSAADVASEVAWIADTVSHVAEGTASIARPSRRGFAVAALVITAAVLAAVSFPRMRAPSTMRRVIRFAIDVPATRAIDGIALSPDGSRLAYIGIDDDVRRLYVRALDRFVESRVAGSEGVGSAFFSPDSQSIAFLAENRLMRVTGGGEVLTVAETSRSQRLGPAITNHGGGTWLSDGSIVFPTESGLVRVPAGGGSQATLTTATVAGGDNFHLWPRAAGGEAVIFTVSTGQTLDRTSLDAITLHGVARRHIADDAALGQYVPGGYLLYAVAGRIVAAPFDSASLRLDTSAAVPVLQGVAYVGPEPLVTLSSNGDLAFVEPPPPVAREFVRVDRQGRSEAVMTGPPDQGPSVSLSPDGTKIAVYSVGGHRFSIWIVDLLRSTRTRLATEGQAHAPVWTADGAGVTLSSDRNGRFNLVTQAADGGAAPTSLVVSPLHQDPGSWSRDGRWLAYAEMDPKTGFDLWAFDAASGKPQPFRRTAFNESFPAISPDGRWVAYVSDESGRRDVFAEAFPGGGSRLQISSDGGIEPNWSPDGHELFYRNAGRLLSVRVREGSALSASPAVALFEAPFDAGGTFGTRGYAVAPDGQHFYFVRTLAPAQMPHRIQVVLNWVDEFREQLKSAGGR